MTISQFIEARRALLSWRLAKDRLFEVIPARDRKVVLAICGGNPLAHFQFVADLAACSYADKYGDSVFRCTIDGEPIFAPTELFYGQSLLTYHSNSDGILRIFMLSDQLSELESRARAFMSAVRALPGTHTKKLERRLAICERKYRRDCEKARSAIERRK